MQQKTVLPDNIGFFKKNPNNHLPVNLGNDNEVSLNYTNSIGESEVAVNLLGIPRSETRGVLYEDVSTYGLNPNNWIYNVSKSIFSGYGAAAADPNMYTSNNLRALSRDRLKGRKVNILAGTNLQWLPDALDANCDNITITQGDKYKLYKKTFQPIIYHDAETSCITMEGFPSSYGYELPGEPQRCSVYPGAWYESNAHSLNYWCKLESRETYRYEPGRVLGFTFGISTSVRDTYGYNYSTNRPQHKQAKWGVRNKTDSYYFLLDGTELSVVRESVLEENNIIMRSSRFYDKLDGTGPSKAKIDFSKVTMYCIEFSWYGAIGASFFVYLPVGLNETRWVKIADLPSSNTYSIPALSDPYMKMFMELDIPWRVAKPHFLKKYGTSVYVDGLGVNNPNFSKSGSVSNIVKNIEKDYDKNLLVVEVPEKTEYGYGKTNKNKFQPINLDVQFNEPTLLTIERVLDNNKHHYTMPLLTLGLTGTQNINKMFYDGSGKPLNSFSNLQEYSDDLFDFVLPLNGDVYANDDSIEVTVPENYDINEVARYLMNNFILIRSPLHNNRITWTNTTVGYTGSLGNFNYIKGVELLPKISAIRRSGRNLICFFERNYYMSNAWYPTDGVLANPPESLDHLDDGFISGLGGVEKYPNYSEECIGTINSPIAGGKPFGGTISAQEPVFDNTCKVVINKNYYNNQSYYIFNSKIDSGVIRFQPPSNEYLVGFINQSVLNSLTSNNFYKNAQIADGQIVASDVFNIQENLRKSSVVSCHRYLYYAPTYGTPINIFERWEEPIASIYYYSNKRLKVEYYTLQPSGFGFNNRPMHPYNGSFWLMPQVKAGGSNNWLQVVDSSSSGTFGFTIKRIKAKILVKNPNSGNSFQVGLTDVLYLKDGVYTVSNNFWTLLLNNYRHLGSNARFTVNGANVYPTYIRPTVSRPPDDGLLKNVKLAITLASPITESVIDLDLRVVTYCSMQKPGEWGAAYVQSPLYDDFGLGTTAIIPENENLYFYYTSTMDINGSKNYFFPNMQGIKTNLDNYDSKNEYDYKFCLTKFEVRDKNGIQSSNTSSVYNNGYYVEKDLWVKASTNPPKSINLPNAKQSLLALSGTTYQQNVTKLRYINSMFFAEDNNYTQIFRNSTKNTYTFLIPGNVKKRIDLTPYFNLDRERILPTLYSDFTEFNTFMVVKARTLGAKTAQGNITFNFKELV